MGGFKQKLYFRFALVAAFAALAMAVAVVFALRSRILEAVLLGVALIVVFAAFTAVTVWTERTLGADLRDIGAALEKMVTDEDFDHMPRPRLAELAGFARDLGTVAAKIRESYWLMAEEQGRLQAVLESISAGIILLDRDGRVVMINPAAERILGTTSDAAVGRSFTEVHHSTALDRAIENLKPGVGVSEEIRITHPRERLVRFRASPLLNEEGAMTGTVCVLDDITSRRELERVRRDFVANVSHELRTPVANKRAVVDALLAGAWEDGEARERFARDLDRESARLAGIIEDLLIISRLESDGTVLSREEITVEGLLTEAVEDRLESARRNNVRVVAVRPEEPLVLRGDKKLLSIALSNLVDYAIKYNRAGGRVELRAWRGPDSLNISVSDTGIGIPERDRLKVFERFYRVDGARSRETGGTGLGLSIVRHVAEVHGGAVSLESIEGEGSTFTMEFPLAPSLF